MNLRGISVLVTDGPSYTTYGRFYFLVFLGFLLGLLALHAHVQESAGRLGRAGFRVLFLGLVASLLGCIMDYWLKWMFVFRETAPALHIALGVGYSLALFSTLVGSVLYGLAIVRSPVVPRWGSKLLIASGPVGLLLSLVHVPSGTMLLASTAWLVLGYSLWCGPFGRGVRW